ncbi:hypothetical protein HKX48_006108 [Thoreauomyces humboldtii]|nr:hypothetical protein HKX48_006108 [Thoreauomyces humboldtii]
MHFDSINNRHFQENCSSGACRPARRRSFQAILEPVDRATLDVDERCVMCQQPCLSVGDDGEEEEVVKLKVCVGHWFHRGCIQSYVMLRGSCPVCFKTVSESEEFEEDDEFDEEAYEEEGGEEMDEE